MLPGQVVNLLHSQVVHSTIKTDLEDINAKVHQAATDLRKERIRLIKVSFGVLYYKNEKLFSDQIKAKEITGEDIEIDVGEIDTDVIVDVNINELARTEGIVSTETR